MYLQVVPTLSRTMPIAFGYQSSVRCVAAAVNCFTTGDKSELPGSNDQAETTRRESVDVDVDVDSALGDRRG